MKVRVRFFAYLRDVTGTPAVDLEVQEGATVADVERALAARWPALEIQLTRIPVVVDEKLAELGDSVHDGAEVVWLPPVGGGSVGGGSTDGRRPGIVRAAIVRDPIDSAGLLAEVATPSAGGVVLFVGTVRDHDEGRDVTALHYDAYEPLAAREIRAVAEEALARWPMARIAAVHRVGKLDVGEASVAVAVACPHRDEAFACCRHVIDRVKEALPVWKKELGSGGSQWLAGRDFKPASGSNPASGAGSREE